jgi:DNA-directed RNA polymerase I subunit RPA1
LLERGLLDAAEALEDMRIKTKSKRERDNEGDLDIEEEEISSFINRVNLFTAVALSKAPSHTRDQHKNLLVYEARKTLIHQFLRLAASQKKCYHDGCHA